MESNTAANDNQVSCPACGQWILRSAQPPGYAGDDYRAFCPDCYMIWAFWHGQAQVVTRFRLPRWVSERRETI